MNGFLTKPVNQPQLFDLLDAIGRTLPAATDRPDARAELISPIIADPALARHAADLFLQTTPDQLDRLGAAVAARDAGSVRAIAHALRGAMANFSGANPGAAERLEDLGESGDVGEAQDALAELLHEIDRLEKRLRTFLDARPA
jgi:HPt (histidine-containing phosphotransfer) domain-containing protein